MTPMHSVRQSQTAAIRGYFKILYYRQPSCCGENLVSEFLQNNDTPVLGFVFVFFFTYIMHSVTQLLSYKMSLLTIDIKQEVYLEAQLLLIVVFHAKNAQLKIPERILHYRFLRSYQFIKTGQGESNGHLYGFSGVKTRSGFSVVLSKDVIQKAGFSSKFCICQRKKHAGNKSNHPRQVCKGHILRCDVIIFTSTSLVIVQICAPRDRHKIRLRYTAYV